MNIPFLHHDDTHGGYGDAGGAGEDFSRASEEGELVAVKKILTPSSATGWKMVFSSLGITTPFLNAVVSAPEGFGLVTKGGVFLPVRAVQDEDAPALKLFLQHLSKESRYTRFHSAMPVVRDSVAYHLADRDGYTKVAFIATDPNSYYEDEGGETFPVVVALAEYALPVDGDKSKVVPEVAIAVADEWQGKGVGTQMLKILGTLSIAAGHNVWTAEILTSNEPVRKILGHVGKVKTVTVQSGESTLRVKLQPEKVFNTRHN